MVLRYQTGLEIRKGDRVLFHGEPGEIEFVADPEKLEPGIDSYLREYGTGVMVREPKHFGRAFISDPSHAEDLRFISRDLEAMLADEVREYIAGREDEAEPEKLRSIYSTFARLLNGLLEGAEGWSPYYWVDDILQSSIAILSDNEVIVLGWMIWGETKQTGECVEPFRAFVHLPDGNDAVFRYEICCGDAAQGLGKKPYEDGLAYRDPALPEQWLFRFSLER